MHSLPPASFANRVLVHMASSLLALARVRNSLRKIYGVFSVRRSRLFAGAHLELRYPFLEREFRRNLADTRISGMKHIPEGRIANVSVHGAVWIELGVVEDVEHLKT